VGRPGERPCAGNTSGAYFLNITVNQTATLLIGAIGILMLSLWMRRRRDTAYAYFGISALVWALQSTNLYVRKPAAVDRCLGNSQQCRVPGVFRLFLLISLLRFVSIGGRPLIAALWAAARDRAAQSPAGAGGALPYGIRRLASLHPGLRHADPGSAVFALRCGAATARPVI
jgi:hypothetical protein